MDNCIWLHNPKSLTEKDKYKDKDKDKDKYKDIQFSKSSQSKNGGAYFSAVCGSNLVPVSATEGHEHRVCNRLLGFYSPGTFGFVC